MWFLYSNKVDTRRTLERKDKLHLVIAKILKEVIFMDIWRYNLYVEIFITWHQLMSNFMGEIDVPMIIYEDYGNIETIEIEQSNMESDLEIESKKI